LTAADAAAAASANDTRASTVWTIRNAVSWSVVQTEKSDVAQTAAVTTA
jgi:hypothetical protein